MEKKVVNLWENWWKLWNKIGPPWRPSAKDIKYWEKRIQVFGKKRNLKVLLLGSTPETRDMLARNNISPTILEANRSMYDSMSKMRKVKRGKEKVVIGNWLKADKIFKKNSFDIVMGDLPHCNIPYKLWPKFFINIYNILKPGGYFMVATVVYDYPERQTIKEMLVKYKKNKKYFKNFKNRLWELYQILDEPGVYNKEERKFNIYKLREPIKKEALKYFSLEEFDKNIWFISGDINGEMFNDVIEVGPSLEEQIVLQLKWFSLDSLYLVPDHPAFKIRRSMILRNKKLK